jgi:hypothetical protein
MDNPFKRSTMLAGSCASRSIIVMDVPNGQIVSIPLIC